MTTKFETQLDDLTEALKDHEKHICNQTNTFGLLNNQIKSNKSDISSNDKSIKRLYMWQATVGISLLAFFLTVGVASLRYVDKIDFTVQSNSKEIIKIPMAQLTA